MAGVENKTVHRKNYALPSPPVPKLPTAEASVYDRVVFVNREKTCPMLLRVFTKVGSHHTKEDFANGQKPKSEFQIYTWKDATLRELTDLVRQVTPEARRREAWLSFALAFPGREGHIVVRRVGKTFSYGIKKVDDDKALGKLGFEIGDFLDVAIF